MDRPNRLLDREAQRLARLDATRIGDEFRQLRLGLGVSQSAVARLVGVSQSSISDLERGDPTVGLVVRRRAAIVVGADLRINLYPGATPLIHDASHARIIEHLLVRRHRIWRADLEARVPGLVRASTDVRLSKPGTIVLIEVETHVRRWEELLRRIFEKREQIRLRVPEGTNVFAALCLPPTRHHRRLVAELGESARAAFPVPPHQLRRALEGGLDWPGDGILWVASGARATRAA
jgi:transcriptional regulator with XRE-family HTH domain